MNEREELLVDLFFDHMHHNAAIVYPYYADPEYAHNIKDDYLESHPDFVVPEKDENNSYKLSSDLLNELKAFCDERCAYYGYDKEDDAEEDEDALANEILKELPNED